MSPLAPTLAIQSEVPGIWVCPVCGKRGQTSHAFLCRHGGAGTGVSTTRPQSVQAAPCVHRGDVIEKNAVCELCGARGELYDVFACDIHGQCSLSKRSTKLKSCGGCSDFQSTNATPSFNTEPTARAATVDQPLKIAFLVPCLSNPGGLERWLISLCRHLPQVGGRRIARPLAVITHPATVDPEYLSELQQVADVHILHNTGNSQTMTRRAVAACDLAIVSGMGDPRFLLDGFTGPVVWCCHSCCDRSKQFSRECLDSGLITHWASVSEIAVESFPPEIQSAVTILENGADVERCVPARGRDWQRQQWGIRSDQIAVGFVGRLAQDKRPISLAETIAALPSQYLGIYVGTGHDEKLIQREARRLTGDRCRFVGRSTMLGDTLSGLDLWLLASPAEGFCLARTEAHLAGLPVVTTPTGEIPRLEAQHGPLTWTVPVGSTGKTIAAAVIQLQSDADKTKELCNRARQLAWGRYTAPAMAARWADYLLATTSR